MALSTFLCQEAAVLSPESLVTKDCIHLNMRARCQIHLAKSYRQAKQALAANEIYWRKLTLRNTYF